MMIVLQGTHTLLNSICFFAYLTCNRIRADWNKFVHYYECTCTCTLNDMVVLTFDINLGLLLHTKAKFKGKRLLKDLSRKYQGIAHGFLVGLFKNRT